MLAYEVYDEKRSFFFIGLELSKMKRHHLHNTTVQAQCAGM